MNYRRASTSSPDEDDLGDPVVETKGKSLQDFYGDDTSGPATFFSHRDSSLAPGKLARQQLEVLRNRFASTVSISNDHPKCCAVDRAAVLAVYAEALDKLNAENYEQISTEVRRKTRVILGLTSADPEDSVFVGSTTGGSLLSPLEPQYSEPRIEFKDDEYQRLVHRRISAWRKDGWPKAYPRNAIKYEAQTREALDRREERDLDTMVTEDSGEEVDADGSKWDPTHWAERQEQKRSNALKRGRRD